MQEDQAWTTTSRTSIFLIVTASFSSDGILSLMVLAASSDSKTTKLNPPPSPPPVQYPATNPWACDTPGTTCSRIWLLAASGSLTVSVVTSACVGASFLPLGGLKRLSLAYEFGEHSDAFRVAIERMARGHSEPVMPDGFEDLQIVRGDD